MKEGRRGSHKIAGEILAPEEAIEILKNSGCWSIKYSPSSGNFYFQTMDYHPGDLELSVEDLEQMIKYAKEHKQIKI